MSDKKVFNIGIELDADFVDCLNGLIEKYGSELAKLNGFAPEQLNYTDFIDNFIDKKTVADASIDGNANVRDKDIVTLMNEMSKPHQKLLSFNKIFYEMKKKWGKEAAIAFLEKEYVGIYYLHDAYSASFVGYCYAADVDKVAKEGLFFFNNGSHAPQHLVTFTDFVCETVSYAENRSAGAFGLPSFLVWSFYFWHKDVENGYYIKTPEYYRDQEFQRVIYKLNQPYLRSGIQSAFTNFNIFDHPYFEALFGGVEFPDGTYAIDFEDEIIEYQKAFMEVVSKTRQESMFTFPVLTYSLLRQNGKFVDEPFARWACEHNMKWADSNFYISDSVDSLSSCCFSYDTEVLWKSSSAGVNQTTFKELWEAPYKGNKENFKVFHNGAWVEGKPIRISAKGHTLYKIKLANHTEMIATENHLFPTLFGDVRVDELETNDYILMNTRALNRVNETSVGYGYDEGYLLGAYLGDGSRAGGKSCNAITLSLTENKYNRSFDKICRATKAIDPNASVNININESQHGVWFVNIRSEKVYDFIFEYMSGYRAETKSLNLNCLLESKDFRAGIIDGIYDTDGGNSNRIYTSSVELAKDLVTVLTSLGRVAIVDCSDRTSEPVIIRGGVFKRNYPLWCVRFYAQSNKRDFVNVYKTRNNSVYFKITSVEKVEYNDHYVYCFEMENEEEPYFTLPNGVITHNCRLRNAIKGEDTPYFNSIGGTALNVGSVKVNTINLARLAYIAENDTKQYLQNVYNATYDALKVLDIQRHIIERNIEKGLLPNYTSGLIDITKQYSTIGCVAGAEAIEHFGLTQIDEFGNFSYTDEGLTLYRNVLAKIHEAIDAFKKDNNIQYMVNLEQVPAERAAAILMEKDQIFYPNEKYSLPLYGNQWIPLAQKATLKDRTITCGVLDNACNGGSIEHINVDAPFNNFETAWYMLNWVADQGVTYFAFCTRISACENNHGFYGNVCPICGKPVDTTYQRVAGFLTPVKSYSKERKAEFAKRDWMDLNAMEDLQ